MEIRFFRINDLNNIGVGEEKYLNTIKADVIPQIGSYVCIDDTFSREVASVYYYYDEDEIRAEVFLYTNPVFEISL
jgi:hypothetical protein